MNRRKYVECVSKQVWGVIFLISEREVAGYCAVLI